MNILPMRYYLAVVKHDGISAAAKELFITQQTLSAHIAAIEKELGCVLFERKPVFRLTDAGMSFYQYCEKMVALDEQMHREFSERQKEPVGILRIGISQTRSRIMIPPVAMNWRKKFPGVKLVIKEMINDQIVQETVEGKLEIGIGNIHNEIPELQVENLHQERIMLLVPKTADYRELKNRNSQDIWQFLGKYPFILHRDHDIVGRYGKKMLEERGIVPNVAVISDNAETCMEMCQKGLGLYICPDFFLKTGDISDECFAISLNMEFTISAAWRKNIYQSRLAGEFIQMLKSAQKEIRSND